MPEQTKSADASDLCMEASYRMYEQLRALCESIEALQDPYISPEDPLPVDKFLSNMPERKNSPEVIFQPPLLRSELWTKNLTCYVYASLEQAFVTAGNVPGKDRSGQASELRALLKWVDEQLNDPQRSIPDDFFHRTTYLFRRSYLRDRRSERMDTLIKITTSQPTDRSALLDLRSLVQKDLDQGLDGQMGSPERYQKIMFAVEIANLWHVLTGRKITRGPYTVFARFLESCWASGFETKYRITSFKWVLRNHIEENKNAAPCRKCTSCLLDKKCKRTRYIASSG